MPNRPEKSYASISKYTKFLRQFPKMKRMFRGNFYTFVYDVDELQNFNTIKFYDLMPLIFMVGRHEKYPNIIQGINFHHLPLNVRMKFLELIKNIVTEDFKQDKRLIRIAKYDAMFRLFRKASKFAIRQYYMENIRHLRKVPKPNIEEALKYYANTYYGINISNVEKNYNKFII